MKKILFTTILFAGFYFAPSCKEPTHYWNPVGEFPLLRNDGSVSPDAKDSFSMQTVDDQFDILVINFFAPECKPCIVEVPDLKKIYATIQTKKNIKFVGIGSRLSALSDENITDVNTIAPEIFKFTRDFKLDYPAYLARTDFMKNYGLTGFPETFIMYRNADRKWYVKRRFLGMITEKDINPFLH